MTSDQRLPPQGGLPPLVGALTAVEIACDESGFSGTNLLDAATPVFTHASVDLGIDEAVELIGALRSRVRWSLDEFKSGRLLRGAGAGEVAAWLPTALGDRAHVHVVDKEFFLVTRIIDLFLAEPSYAAGTSLTQHQRPTALCLYRAGRTRDRVWRTFLAVFVELVRTRKRQRPDRRVVERFFRARDALADAGFDQEAQRILDGLSRTRVRAILNRLVRDDRSIPPPLEPLLPALAETVLFWSGGGRRPVLVIHDEQSALTADRLRRLQEALTDGAGGPPGPALEVTPPAQVSPLAGLVTVDSRDDPRVQVADLLAGVARRSQDLGVTDAVRPLLSTTSLWDPER